MAVQIGAKIGIEGEAEYRRAISEIITTTKKLKAEFNEIESSIGKNKTIQDVAKQRENLNQQLQETTKILQKQQEVLDKAKQHNLNENAKIGIDWAEKDLIPDSKIEKYETNLIRTQTELNNLQGKINELPSNISLVTSAWKNATSDWGDALSGVGATLTKYVTVPLTVAAGVSVKSFSDWETAFTGVKKTVEGTDEELAKVAEGITDIALSSASSREDIAGVAEVAGQLGIGVNDITEFTRTMVMLGDSTNLASDEAATAIARILNITGETSDKMENYNEHVRKLGNSIVYLGNNFATSESEIVHMANRLAAGGTIAGLTTQEIFGLATAMSSVGITAEAGGTAMTQTLSKIEKEVASFTEGTENSLPKIAEIAGMSAEAFADAWENRPAEAIQAFIGGLGALDEKGESATIVLDELEMAGIRQSNMLKSLALASDVMTKAMEGSNYAYNESNALLDEATKKYETFGAQTNQLKESFKVLGSEVGKSLADLLLPVVEKLTDFVVGLANAWKNLPQPIKDFILVLGGIVAAVGPILVVVGSILTFVAKVKVALGVLGVTMGGFAATAILPIVAGIGILAAAITGIIAVVRNWSSIMEWLKNVFSAVGEACKIFGDLVSEVFKLLGDWLGEKISNIASNVGKWFGDMKDKAVNHVSKLYDGATNWFSKLKDKFTNDSDGIQKNVSKNFELAQMNSVGSITQLDKDSLAKLGQTKANIDTSINNIKNSISNGFANAKTNAISRINELNSGVANTFNNLRNNLSNTANNIASSIYNAFSNARNNAVNMVSNMYYSVLGWFDSMRNGVANKVGAVSSAIVNGISGAVSYLRNLGSQAWSWGSDMISNFTSGIRSATSWVTNAVSNVANTVRRFLHFSEPDVGPLSDFSTYMPDMMRLMAKGINDNAYLVEDALGNVTGMMANNVQNGGSGMNYNYGGVVINLNVPEGANGRMLVDEIETELANRTMRRKAVFG